MVSGDREKVCGVRVGHHTEGKAIKIAAADSVRTDNEYAVYQCPYCLNWHIGPTITSERDTPSSSPSTPASDPQADRWWD